MNKLFVRMLLVGSTADLIRQLLQARSPQNTSFACEATSEQDALTIAKDELDTVLVTDRIPVVQHVVDEGFQNTKVVFVGSEEDLVAAFGATPSAVAAVWAANACEQQATRRMEQLLEDLRAKFDAWLYQTWLMSLIDSLPDIIWYKEASGLHNLVNQQFCKVVRKTREDVTDKGHCYIWNVPPESEYQCAETDNAVMTGGKLVVADEKVETDNGMRQFRTYKSPVRGRAGQIIGTVGLGHDVTDFTNMGMELEILMDNLPYPVALADNSWLLVGSNARFREAFGLSKQEVKNLDYRSWRDSLEYKTTERMDANGNRQLVHDLVVDNDFGQTLYELLEPAIIDYFNNVSGYYCIFRDVTIERTFENQAIRFANTDPLTGLANRRRFHAFLDENTGKPMGILNLDLDNFKRVNDTYGHAMGDEVLVRIALMIRELAPEGLVARLGGDEFSIAFASNMTEQKLRALAATISTSIHSEFVDLNVGLGCSVGVARTDALSQNPEELLMVADRQMYKHKTLHHANE